jgi:hypothetical protein
MIRECGKHFKLELLKKEKDNCHIISFHSKFGIGMPLFVNRSLSSSGLI